MGLGGYVFCEHSSIENTRSPFYAAMQKAEKALMESCQKSWFPTKTPMDACGWLKPKSGEQFGRTTILPALFNDHSGNQMATWRQLFTASGHQTLLTAHESGNVLKEDFKIAWLGLAFPNKEQHITEIKAYIGDTKFGRINIEELHMYESPALIFEEGFLINEKENFELYGFVEGPIPVESPFILGEYQSIVPLGAVYYKVKDNVLGVPGAVI